MYVLPKLPYAYNALEPVMSDRTLRFHHDKHHAGYVKALNELLGVAGASAGTLEAVILDASKTEKRKLFSLLDAEASGITLTESFAMLPAASVSGLYFAHPEARYFNIGRIDRDQVEDYARRKAMAIEDVEKWLGPSLGYDPAVKSRGAAA